MTDPDHAARWALDDEELESLMIGATPEDLGRVGNPVAEFFADARNARGVRQPSPDRSLTDVFSGDLGVLDDSGGERPRMSAPPHPGGNGSSELFRSPGDERGLSALGGSGWSGPEVAPITGAHEVSPRRGANDSTPLGDPWLTAPAADLSDPFADAGGPGRSQEPFPAASGGPFGGDPFGAPHIDAFGAQPGNPFAAAGGPDRPGDPFADPYGAPTIADAPLRGSLLAERTAAHNRLVVPPAEAPTTSAGAFLSQVFEPTAPKVLMGVALVAVMFTAGQLLGLYSLPFVGGGGVDNQAITGFEAQTEGGIVGQEPADAESAAADQSSTVAPEIGSSLVTVPLPDVAAPVTASTTTTAAPRNTTTPTVAPATTTTTVEDTTTTTTVDESTTTVDDSSTTETSDGSTSSTDTTVEDTTTTTVEETTTTAASETTVADPGTSD